MKEIWKNVPGYNGKYQISNNGKVRIVESVGINGELEKSHMLNVDKGGFSTYYNNNFGYEKVYELLKLLFGIDRNKTLNGEEWKEIIGYDGMYFVSNLGRVKKSSYITKSNSSKSEIILKSRKGTVVLINKNNEHQTVQIAALLLDYFGIGDVEDLDGEEWRDIFGYEGKYQVSNLGRVKRLNHYTKTKSGKIQRNLPKLLTPDIGKYGYYRVQLNKKKYLVHRLVATAFISNPHNYPCVDHIDTNPANNTANNLHWCTYEENMANPITRDKIDGKEQKGKSVQVLKHGDVIAEFKSISSLARHSLDSFGMKLSRKIISDRLDTDISYNGLRFRSV